MLVLVLLLGVIAASGQDKQQTQTILFVCEHGSAKSVIAAAHFNRLAKERNLPYHAIARGLNPDPEIPQQVRVNLAKDGLDVATWKPQAVAEKDVREAARVVTFGCRVPFPEKITTGKLVDWQGVPSTSEDYERARTIIVDKIEALIKTLTLNEGKDRSSGRKGW
jgi:arsenate reductase (thioredoxin)